MSAPTGPAEVRASAAIIVAAVIEEGRSLDDVLATESDEGSARGLKRSLCYGTLRWHVRLAAVLNALATRSPDQLPPRLRALIEIGLFQLVAGETAAHAAVSETVSAARVLGFEKAAGFVNAILRRFQREQADILHAIDRDLALRTAHPRWFVDALRADRGEAALAALDANNAHPPLWVRVNSMRGDVAWAKGELEAAGFTVTPHPLARDALQVAPPSDVRSLPGFMDGRISVQDAAAQLAVHLVRPVGGQTIVELGTRTDEETPSRPVAPGEPLLEQRLHARLATRLAQRGHHDVLHELPCGFFDDGDLEGFLRSEVSEQPALREAGGLREAADREARHADQVRDLEGARQDRLSCLFALGHESNIERSCFLSTSSRARAVSHEESTTMRVWRRNASTSCWSIAVSSRAGNVRARS